jgi:hypothetical protein
MTTVPYRVISQQAGCSTAHICMWSIQKWLLSVTPSLVPLRAVTNSCVITRSEVVTVLKITRWQNKSQNGGTKFCYVFRLLVSLEFKPIISCVLSPSTKARPYPKYQVVNSVFRLFSSQTCEIKLHAAVTCGCTQAPWSIESNPLAMCELVNCAGCVVMPARSCCHRQMSVCLSVYSLCVLLAAADILQPSQWMRGFTPPYPPYLTKGRYLSTQEF